MLLLIGLYVNWPVWQAHVFFNRAQLARLSGNTNPGYYVRALALAPDNDHMRWQAALALVELGQSETAAELLLPFVPYHDLDQRTANFLLNTLIVGRRDREAARSYQNLHSPPPPSSPAVAAHLLRGALQQSVSVPPEMTRRLLTTLFGLSEQVEAFQSFGAQLSDPDFWNTELGVKTRHALDWYTGPVAHTSTMLQVEEPDRQLLAELLNVPAEAITFGPELVTNGSFEQYDHLRSDLYGWHFSFMSTGEPWNLAAFVVGLDTQHAWDGELAIRIEGLYRETYSERQPARAGFWHQHDIAVTSGVPYVVSFVYRTEGFVEETAAVWVSSEDLVFWNGDKILPNTDGQWSRVTAVAWNRSGKEAKIRPLLRSWREGGSVWFDACTIREIILSAPHSVEPQEPIFQFSEKRGIISQ